MALERNRRGQSRNDAIGNDSGFLGMIQLREQHHELVAPQSGDSVAVPNDIH